MCVSNGVNVAIIVGIYSKNASKTILGEDIWPTIPARVVGRCHPIITILLGGLFFLVAGIEFALIHDQKVKVALLLRLDENVFFDRMLGDKSIYMHVARLPDSVSAILSLGIHCWVPVTAHTVERVGGHE